ncbi:MAG TPA: valine--tRNA ligase [Gemmatimonadota bacterium]|nr:valine--tRNA ligase [Gemmatimonadota bacterium]
MTDPSPATERAPGQPAAPPPGGLPGRRYDPSALEGRWYALWRGRGYFHPPAGEGPDPYTIVIPPPNVTGVLHMGHALNTTLQDVLVRQRRMAGHRALYLPGTDHAGIATQNVVERELADEGLSRDDLGREAFVDRVWAWREKYGDEIYDQLMQLGISCDWERARFTMDPGLSRAVREVFVRLYDDGLVYRGKYIIHWCPRCGTALSDEEAEKHDTTGRLYYVRYPVHGGIHVVVATTRPETMLGDTGVAVHPDDPRFRDLVGRTAVLPLVGRALPIVADDFVDPQFGTGAVKVTPAHDPNDFWIGERHGLERVNVLNPDATMNEAAGRFAGLDRFEARRQIVAALEEEGYLEKVEDHAHAVGRCYRCGTVVEPYLSDQWFVRMKPLAEPALAAARDGTLRFTPQRWTKVYEHWLENVRDWCISRQIWWGHRIPVWTCGRGHVFAAREDPDRCPECGSAELQQETDVLDTWFSAWLWPFSTLGWPDETEDLATFYPTQTLVTGAEILFFWVARMVMAGYYCTGRCPFTDVVIHGTVRDERGRRMSKSLGNGIDPREVIAEHGADALRFTLVTAAPTGTDLQLAPDHFIAGRNFANKLWNAARFVFLNVPESFAPSPPEKARPEDAGTDGAGADRETAGDEQEAVDRWILHRLDETTRAVDASLAAFRIGDAAGAIYSFLWHDYCDWYIEWCKAGLDRPHGDRTRSVLLTGLERSLRLLHPFMPFITEEIWQALPAPLRAAESIMIEEWPGPAGWDYPEEAGRVALMQEIIGRARNLRAEYGVPPGRRAPLIVAAAEPKAREELARHAADIARLAGASETRVVPDTPRGDGTVVQVVRGGIEVAVRLADLVDVDKERERLTSEIRRTEALLGSTRHKLADREFIARAPDEVVERERRKAVDLEGALERLNDLVAALEPR